MKTYRCTASRGFTLLEAVVALVVLAFGMLAIAGFQLNLSRGSDVAKQRTEATRLAQQKMEELRAFPTVVPGGGIGYADLQSSAAPETAVTTSNTTYTRSWTVSGSAFDPQRTITVTVAWTDRAGDNDQVVLQSVISKSNPADIGSLRAATVPSGFLYAPKGRNPGIPIRAVDIPSSDPYQPPERSRLYRAGRWFAFLNESGEVFDCGGTTMPTNDTNLLSECTKVTLLAGYISAAQGATLPSETQINAKFVDGTRPDGVTPVIADVGGPPVPGTLPLCFVEATTDDNDPSTPIAGFLTYGCLVTTANHAVPTPPATTPPAGHHWSARVELFGTVSVKVCRFGYDPLVTDTEVDNDRHPPTYIYVGQQLASGVFIDRSLGNQNYVLIPVGSPCAGTPGAREHQATLPAS
jgi:Tfp pilus assembly protein PilV